MTEPTTTRAPHLQNGDRTMTTAATPRQFGMPPPQAQRAPAAATGGFGGGVPIDPVKLLKQYWPWLALAVLVGSGLGIATHFVMLAVYPTYKSTVLYECLERRGDPRDIVTPLTSKDDMDRFMGTQAAAMTSDNILLDALKEGEVAKTQWAQRFMVGGRLQPQNALAELADDISARPQAQTNLVQLTMSWRTPNDVAVIVNAVDRVYREELKRRGRVETTSQREALNKQLEQVERTITDLTKRREELLERQSVDALDERSSAEASLVLTYQTLLGKADEELAELQSIAEQHEEQLRGVQGIIFSDRTRQRALDDDIIRNFDFKIADLKSQERALLEQGYGQAHDEIRSVRTTIDAVDQEKATEFEKKLREAFDVEVDGVRTGIASKNAQKAEYQRKIDEATARRETLVATISRFEQMGRDLERAQNERERLSNTIAGLEITDRMDTANRIAVRAFGRIPEHPSFPRLKLLVPLGAVLGLALVGGFLVSRELLDQRVRGPADIALIPRLSVLGLIPQASEDPSKPPVIETAFRDRPTGVIAESYRQIRAPLGKRLAQGGHKTLLVLAGMPGSGATTVACNLALGFAASGNRVLLMDANLRRPGVHKVFGLPEGPGLGDVLAAGTTFTAAVRPSPVPNLSVLSAGTGPSRAVPEHLATDAMGRVLTEASGAFDLVVIDSAPAMVSGDGIVLANRCDAVALVVRAMGEKRGLVARVRSQLADTHSELLGVIVNAVRSSAGGYMRRNIRETHQYRKETV